MEADSKRALALFTGSGTSGQQGGEARASATEEKTVQKAVVRWGCVASVRCDAPLACADKQMPLECPQADSGPHS